MRNLRFFTFFNIFGITFLKYLEELRYMLYVKRKVQSCTTTPCLPICGIWPNFFYFSIFVKPLFSRRSSVGNRRFVVLCCFWNIWMSILIDFCALSSNQLKFWEKNPRWRRYLSSPWKLVLTLNFSKIDIFQKFLLLFLWFFKCKQSMREFVFENNPKWRHKPRWWI